MLASVSLSELAPVSPSGLESVKHEAAMLGSGLGLRLVEPGSLLKHELLLVWALVR